MAYHGNPYSEEEDAIIRQGYASAKPLEFIASRLGRTLQSVGSRAQLLGIRHPNGTRNGNAKRGNWSRSMDDLVMALPTLAFVPHIELKDNTKYVMRSP